MTVQVREIPEATIDRGCYILRQVLKRYFDNPENVKKYEEWKKENSVPTEGNGETE